MDLSLRLFTRQFIGVVLAALVPVILVAFLSIPYNLGSYPGEGNTEQTIGGRHMT